MKPMFLCWKRKKMLEFHVCSFPHFESFEMLFNCWFKIIWISWISVSSKSRRRMSKSSAVVYLGFLTVQRRFYKLYISLSLLCLSVSYSFYLSMFHMSLTHSFITLSTVCQSTTMLNEISSAFSFGYSSLKMNKKPNLQKFIKFAEKYSLQ